MLQTLAKDAAVTKTTVTATDSKFDAVFKQIKLLEENHK